MGEKKVHRRWRNYLLNKRLQLPYIVLVVVLSLGITAGLGALIWLQSTTATREVVAALNSFGDPSLTAEVGGYLQSADQEFGWLVLGIGVGLTLILLAYVLVMTHHVAGPLYKTSLYFDRIRDGRLPKVHPLRKGDQFEGFFDTFRAAEDALVERAERELAALDDFLTALDAAAPRLDAAGQDAIAELRLLRDAKFKAVTDRPERLFTEAKPGRMASLGEKPAA